jgi:CelD/BcsL family acetyltransferase involved in cellulose biosynthesis
VTSNGYHATVIRSRAELEGFFPDWTDFLATAAPGHTLFQTPEAASAFLTSSCSKATPAVVVVRAKDRIVAIAACYTIRTRFHLSFSVARLLALPVTRLHMLGEQVVIADGLDPDPITHAVFDALRAVPFDVFFVQSLPVGSQLWKAFRHRRPLAGHRLVLGSGAPESNHRLRLPATFDDWLASLGRRTRKNLKGQTRRFQTETAGDLKISRISAEHDVRGFLADADRVYRASWQCRAFGYSPMACEFRREQLGTLARHGWLRSYLLTAGGQPAAFTISYQYGDTLHVENTGFDQRFAHHSPGAVLNYLLIEDLFAHARPDVVDFGFGDADYKRHCGSEATPGYSAHVTRSARWQSLLRLQRGLTRVEAGTRALLVRLGLYRSLRRLIKHAALPNIVLAPMSEVVEVLPALSELVLVTG